jgi:hypothetical protein
LKPKENLKAQVMVRSSHGQMTVMVPRLHPEVWKSVVIDAIQDTPATVTQTGPLEFAAYYSDEVKPMKVRYVGVFLVTLAAPHG